ncbi:MAG: LysR substrate-binding domain-containing protein [Acidobacteriota bacterium]|nr:LysR substrate-binding domain-containing protein [Acidobacteriota bacterium]
MRPHYRSRTARPRGFGLDLSTRHLRALAAVARYGTFAAAASELGISQPTLTRTIQRVEDELGLTLFARTTRRVVMTAAGREFIPLATRLLTDIALGVSNVRELAEVTRGQVVVATLMSVAHGILPAIVKTFAGQYPGVVVNVREGTQASVLEEVRTGSADFGLGDASDTEGPLAIEPLGAHRFSVVLPAGHRLLRRKTVPLSDLTRETLIAMPMESATRRIFDNAMVAAGLSMRVGFTVTQFATAFQLVAQGLGVAVAPATILTGRQSPPVSARPLRAPAVSQHLGLITRSGRVPTPAAFVGVLRQRWRC